MHPLRSCRAGGADPPAWSATAGPKPAPPFSCAEGAAAGDDAGVHSGRSGVDRVGLRRARRPPLATRSAAGWRRLSPLATARSPRPPAIAAPGAATSARRRARSSNRGGPDGPSPRSRSQTAPRFRRRHTGPAAGAQFQQVVPTASPPRLKPPPRVASCRDRRAVTAIRAVPSPAPARRSMTVRLRTITGSTSPTVRRPPDRSASHNPRFRSTRDTPTRAAHPT